MAGLFLFWAFPYRVALSAVFFFSFSAFINTTVLFQHHGQFLQGFQNLAGKRGSMTNKPKKDAAAIANAGIRLQSSDYSGPLQKTPRIGFFPYGPRPCTLAKMCLGGLME